jgi:uncharacterized LabA/DUF88 family protein
MMNTDTQFALFFLLRKKEMTLSFFRIGAVRLMHACPKKGTKPPILRALLIDGENVAPNHMKSIIGRMQQGSGVHLSVRKCFGNFNQNANLKTTWKAVAKTFDIQLVDTPRVAKGKSSTDMSMCVAAIDLCCRANPRIQEFGIASSDCDFLPVIKYLRLAERKVVGFGKRGCKQKYSNAFNKFVALEDLKQQNEAKKPAKKQAKKKPAKKQQAKPTEEQYDSPLETTSSFSTPLAGATAAGPPDHDYDDDWWYEDDEY